MTCSILLYLFMIACFSGQLALKTIVLSQPLNTENPSGTFKDLLVKWVYHATLLSMNVALDLKYPFRRSDMFFTGGFGGDHGNTQHED